MLATDKSQYFAHPCPIIVVHCASCCFATVAGDEEEKIRKTEIKVMTIRKRTEDTQEGHNKVIVRMREILIGKKIETRRYKSDDVDDDDDRQRERRRKEHDDHSERRWGNTPSDEERDHRRNKGSPVEDQERGNAHDSSRTRGEEDQKAGEKEDKTEQGVETVKKKVDPNNPLLTRTGRDS